jgi:signal recognition particle GTPase
VPLSHPCSAAAARPTAIAVLILPALSHPLQVGAALSMVYKTGIPIVYLGVGQKYQDLRKLNVGAVVRALLA